MQRNVPDILPPRFEIFGQQTIEPRALRLAQLAPIDQLAQKLGKFAAGAHERCSVCREPSIQLSSERRTRYSAIFTALSDWPLLSAIASTDWLR